MLVGQKSLLSEVTIIRDVYGKLSFLMDNTESVLDLDKQELATIFHQELGPCFSGKIYWKKLSNSDRKNEIQERQEPIIDILKQERINWKNRDHIQFYLSERPIAKKAWVCQPTGRGKMRTILYRISFHFAITAGWRTSGSF